MLVLLIEPLRNFIHSDLTLNLLSSKLNQKLRHTKSIYILQAYCSSFQTTKKLYQYNF